LEFYFRGDVEVILSKRELLRRWLKGEARRNSLARRARLKGETFL